QIASYSVPFINYFRKLLFSTLTIEIDEYYSKEVQAKYANYRDMNLVSKIPWLKFYTEWRTRYGNFNELPRSFYAIAYEKERRENRIMGIDEFQVERIKHMIEFEQVSPMPEVFDPYGPLVTFYQYFSDTAV
ncbi:MAG: hypothetical protein AAGD05_03005, partial [Bacteroidota bacterium]